MKKSWTYIYNPKGQVAEDVRESVWSSTRFIYTYEYDSKGNWIKRIATVTDQSKLSDTGAHERKTVTLAGNHILLSALSNKALQLTAR